MFRRTRRAAGGGLATRPPGIRVFPQTRRAGRAPSAPWSALRSAVPPAGPSSALLGDALEIFGRTRTLRVAIEPAPPVPGGAGLGGYRVGQAVLDWPPSTM